MKRSVWILLVSLAALALDGGLAAADCSPELEEGEVCQLLVSELRPTQFAVGRLVVDCKRVEIEAKTHKQLKKWLRKKKRQVPAVIGPDGEFYITDRHHLAAALNGAAPDKDKGWGGKDKRMYVRIIKNYFVADDVDADRFWNEMFENRWAWMYDNKGLGPMNPMLLPAGVGGMLNDPYRTLSRWVRESCGYLKAGKDQCAELGPGADGWFMEFHWANFLRETIPIRSADWPVCTSMPYSKGCLPDEVWALAMVYPNAMHAVESEQARQYFASRGLDPAEYGFNASGRRLGLILSAEGCEEVPN